MTQGVLEVIARPAQPNVNEFDIQRQAEYIEQLWAQGKSGYAVFLFRQCLCGGTTTSTSTHYSGTCDMVSLRRLKDYVDEKQVDRLAHIGVAYFKQLKTWYNNLMRAIQNFKGTVELRENYNDGCNASDGVQLRNSKQTLRVARNVAGMNRMQVNRLLDKAIYLIENPTH